MSDEKFRNKKLCINVLIHDQRTISREKLSNLDGEYRGQTDIGGGREGSVREIARSSSGTTGRHSRYQVRSASPVTGEPEPGIGYGKLPCTH